LLKVLILAAKRHLVRLLNQDISDPIWCIRYVICIKRSVYIIWI